MPISPNPLDNLTNINSLTGQEVKLIFAEFLHKHFTPKQLSKIENTESFSTLRDVFSEMLDGSIMDLIPLYFLSLSEMRIQNHIPTTVKEINYFQMELHFGLNSLLEEIEAFDLGTANGIIEEQTKVNRLSTIVVHLEKYLFTLFRNRKSGHENLVNASNSIKRSMNIVDLSSAKELCGYNLELMKLFNRKLNKSKLSEITHEVNKHLQDNKIVKTFYADQMNYENVVNLDSYVREMILAVSGESTLVEECNSYQAVDRGQSTEVLLTNHNRGLILLPMCLVYLEYLGFSVKTDEVGKIIKNIVDMKEVGRNSDDKLTLHKSFFYTLIDILRMPPTKVNGDYLKLFLSLDLNSCSVGFYSLKVE